MGVNAAMILSGFITLGLMVMFYAAGYHQAMQDQEEDEDGDEEEGGELHRLPVRDEHERWDE